LGHPVHFRGADTDSFCMARLQLVRIGSCRVVKYWIWLFKLLVVSDWPKNVDSRAIFVVFYAFLRVSISSPTNHVKEP